MIKINNLCKKYGKLTAVDNLSLNIKGGEVFALLGLNGAGKSTTINILCSLIEKTSGEIEVEGLNFDTERKKIKKIINLAPQETAVANNLTVKENMEFIAEIYGESKENVSKLINEFSLTSKENSKAKTLSGGQKRRLNIAMALISNPKILVLDEPTLGLDVKARKDLWDIIEKLKGKITVLLTTHYLEEAENLADRIAIMKKGKIVAFGTKEEIIKTSGKNNFEDAFLMLAGDCDE